MDWLRPLQTLGTAYLYPALRLAAKLCYIVTIPLHYPIYYLLALIAFLLSPVWYMAHAASRAILAALALVAKLKYLYIYLACAALIGICAGCMLHGTSSFIFVLLGVDASRKRNCEQDRSELPPLEDEEQDYDEFELDSGARPSDSSSWVSTSSFTSAPRPSRSKETKDITRDLLEKQWRLLRSSEKPRRRRRGLLAQTIHEESSSDFS
ncbi:hypothetical protein GGR52DRAFT_84628 [Hypoxylon sp. FL1284]|nr:hypothetical protein GGR52DRAFT_84628 [Hypoxylon sp. FL1284]